jgi:hypothetical protein
MCPEQCDEIRNHLGADGMQVHADPELGQAAPDQVMLPQKAVHLRGVDGAESREHVALFKLHVGAEPPVEHRPETSGILAGIRIKGGTQVVEELLQPFMVADELAAQAGVAQGWFAF